MNLRIAVLWAVSALLALNAFAVTPGVFKTCEDSSFCRRNRHLANLVETGQFQDPLVPVFHIKEGSLEMFPDHIEALLRDKRDDSIEYSLRIYLSEGGLVRVKIEEKDGLKARYEVKDVLVNYGKASEYTRQRHPRKFDETQDDQKEGDFSRFRFEECELLLNHDPLRIDLVYEDAHVISINSKGLMNFEPALRGPLYSSNRTQEKESKSNWGENWKGHWDPMVYGPMSVGIDFTFIGTEYVYGIPEHADRLSLRETRGRNISGDPYRLHNADVFEYGLNSPMSLYGSIPFMLGHNEYRSTGIFWLNAAETWVDISKQTMMEQRHSHTSSHRKRRNLSQTEAHWFSETGLLDFYVIMGRRPTDVFRKYSWLTGSQALPPRFAIGYHQSRWNYQNESDVISVDEGFDTHDIPYDVIWLDIEHTDEKKYFTWDPLKFPDPIKIQTILSGKKRELVTIVDPHIKRDPNYKIHREASENQLFVKKSDGSDFSGWCWPGDSSWIDFLNPRARTWWADKFQYSEYKGSTSHLHLWNDMNEPSVFSGPELTLPKDCVHDGGWEHREIHNLYGFYQQMSTYHGLKDRDNTSSQRPFVLTRSFFAGSQRFGPMWTGDNAADWGHLAITSPMLLSLSISGFAFVGADVGGFFKDPEPELLVRWYQAGAFQPFFRAHAHIDTKRREPWLVGEPYTSAIRKAVLARYQLLPYWYTLFRRAHVDGGPIIRPLFVEYPRDTRVFGLDDQYLIGKDLLVKPITSKSQKRTQVLLPGQQLWYDFETWSSYAPGNIEISCEIDKIPVFVRAGTILPLYQRRRRSSSLMHLDPLTLIVILDKSGQARGELYMDDGLTFDYQKDSYIWKQLTYKDHILTSTGVTSKGFRPASFVSSVTLERIILIADHLNSSLSQVTLEESDSPRDLEFSYHSVQPVNGSSTRIVIKKPDVKLVDDWSIRFYF